MPNVTLNLTHLAALNSCGVKTTDNLLTTLVKAQTDVDALFAKETNARKSASKKTGGNPVKKSGKKTASKKSGKKTASKKTASKKTGRKKTAPVKP